MGDPTGTRGLLADSLEQGRILPPELGGVNMHIHCFFSIPRKLSGCFVPLLLALASTLSAAQDNTFSGTYTFLFGSVSGFTVQQNMFGQQVGFCNGSQLPFGYSCNQQLGQDLITGTLVADGKGKIAVGSTFVFTRDPNAYQCSSRYNATPDCPYKVPSGIAWSSSANYVVGDEVDFTVSGKLLTFQAVKKNTNVPPNTSTCTSSVQPPNCAWDQLYASATGKGSSSGTLTGTYTVQSNGSGVLTVTPSSGNNGKSVSFAMVVPTAPLAVGQVVPIVGLSTLGNESGASGAAVRVK